jgi:hypothetical protein
MDNAELLATFTDRLNQFEKYQGFINKAREQSGKFASAVVEKVVQDNTRRCMEIVEEIVPLTADMEGVLEDLRQNRDAALDSAKESQFRLEELELRLAIGDLSDADFRIEAADYKAVVESTDARVAEIDEERARFEMALDRWNGMGAEAGMLASSPPSSSQASSRGGRSSAPEPMSMRDNSGRDDRSGGGLGMRERERDSSSDRLVMDVGSSSRSSDRLERTGGMRENNNHREPTLRDPVREQMISTREMPARDLHNHDNHDLPGHDSDEMEPVEVGDAEGDDFDIDNYSAGGDFEVDNINVVDGDDEIHIDDGAADKEDKPRRAVLLYQEGTAEEQIYPFTGEVMSLGRGRDNDVQVKNDSKVSRYHCKLYRRGPNFYIEDNKSANGTLVNGELITERRLFGGEEVIIGETFFRFRILD